MITVVAKDIPTFRLVILRMRLKMELKNPRFAQLATMNAARHWLDPTVKTRARALELVNEKLKPLGL